MRIQLEHIPPDFMRVPCIIGETDCVLILPQHEGVKWTPENLIFRSSVWTEQGEPVSLSFKKFFNPGEYGSVTPLPNSIENCTAVQKIDGSTLIVSRFKGELITRIRDAVRPHQLINRGEIEQFKERYPKAFDRGSDTWDHSLIFEWTSPTYRIIVDPGQTPEIRLIGAIHHADYSLFAQQELDQLAQEIGVQRPRTYNFASLEAAAAEIKGWTDQEGVCLYYNNGQDILKLKSDWYQDLHAKKAALDTPRKILEKLYEQQQLFTETEFHTHLAKTYDFETLRAFESNIRTIGGLSEGIINHLAKIKTQVSNWQGIEGGKLATLVKQTYENPSDAGIAFCYAKGRAPDWAALRKRLEQAYIQRFFPNNKAQSFTR